WARPENTSVNYLDETHYADFAAFAAAFAERYRGRVNDIIIWNEPNVSFEWGQRAPDPAAYTELLKATYARAHEKNPDVKILAGALAPNLAPPNSTDAMNDLEYLDKMYQAGAKDYFDTLAVHAYGWKAPADEAPSPDRVNFRRTELLRDIMLKYGDGAKNVALHGIAARHYVEIWRRREKCGAHRRRLERPSALDQSGDAGGTHPKHNRRVRLVRENKLD
ncbi:MAG: hypothetical protein DCC52_17380, partial [Chloroflexi bacterium]